MTNLVDINFTESTLNIVLNVWLLIVVLFLPLMIYFARLLPGIRKGDVELEIKLGKIGSVKIKPNHEVKQIAHKAWVELKTRKAGLPIDKDNDVISDIYKSWYQLFQEIRELARDVPASKLKDEDTRKLINLLIDSLNKGLRPHLTIWQARYSWWYEKAVNDSELNKLTPQDIQSSYPQYQDLVDDMLAINKQLVQYTDQLKKLVDS